MSLRVQTPIKFPRMKLVTVGQIKQINREMAPGSLTAEFSLKAIRNATQLAKGPDPDDVHQLMNASFNHSVVKPA